MVVNIPKTLTYFQIYNSHGVCTRLAWVSITLQLQKEQLHVQRVVKISLFIEMLFILQSARKENAFADLVDR